MIRKKGSIVPRYLLRSIEKRAQHLVKFGCDVEIAGKKITAKGSGYVIIIPAEKYVLKKKRRKTVKGFILMDGVSICGFNESFDVRV